jgi:hypothetical protein
MSGGAQLGVVLGRIASATSTIRTRGEDADSIRRNGGTKADLCQRVRVVAADLNRIADELEATLK